MTVKNVIRINRGKLIQKGALSNAMKDNNFYHKRINAISVLVLVSSVNQITLLNVINVLANSSTQICDVLTPSVVLILT